MPYITEKPRHIREIKVGDEPRPVIVTRTMEREESCEIISQGGGGQAETLHNYIPAFGMESNPYVGICKRFNPWDL